MKPLKIFALPLFLTLFSLPLWAHSDYPSPTDIVKTYFAAVDAGNKEAVSQLLAEDCQAYAPFSPQAMPKQTLLGVVQGFKAGFPDLTHELLSCLESGNSVTVRGIFKGKNDGSLMGNPPTGNQVNVPFNTILELDKSWKIKSIYIQFDQKLYESQLLAGLPNPAALAELNERALFGAMDNAELDKIANYCAADFRISNPFLPEPSPIQAFQGIIQSQKSAFPDMKHTILSIASDGKFVAIRGVFSGTNTGAMMGNPPSGNKLSVPFLVLDELDASGKIKNRYVQFDMKSFESQLMASR